MKTLPKISYYSVGNCTNKIYILYSNQNNKQLLLPFGAVVLDIVEVVVDVDIVRQVGQYFSLISAHSSNNKQTFDS